MRGKWRVVVMVGALFGLVVTSTAASQALGSPALYPTIGYGPARNSFNPHETLLGPGNAGSLHILRSIKVGAGLSSLFAAVSGDTAVVGHLAGPASVNGVYAYSVATGTRRWFHPIPAGANDPTIAGSVVYVPDDAGVLHALSLTTGHQIWAVSLGVANTYVFSPVVSGSTIYAAINTGTSSGKLEARRISNGSLIWSVSGHTFMDAEPTVWRGNVYVGDINLSGTNSIDAFNGSTGTPLWSTLFDGGAAGYVTIAATGVYATSANGVLDDFSPTTGAVQWSKPVSGIPFFQALANGVVYVSSTMGESAYNATTGAPIWSEPTGGGFYPAVADQVLYAGSRAIDTATGSVLYNGHTPTLAPAITGGHLIAPWTQGSGHNAVAWLTIYGA
jgi:outer membrane protein assembly factor BamB